MAEPDFKQLGRLERVDLRRIWESEAQEFTPWLAQEGNLRLLGETIGLELELEAQEQNVGPFRADILCKDTATGHWVLIENQLERTDHTHLGQLLTYAAGLKAVSIVWIANPFSDEHRAALDWLNEVTESTFNFFGLEVEAWRIGDSPAAPKFNVVCEPNEWSRSVARGAAAKSAELKPAQELQLRFWTSFREYVQSRESRIRLTKPLPQHWMNIAIGRSGFQLSAIASTWNSEASSFDTNEIRAEFVITDANAKDYFTLLEAARGEIETELGFPLTWHSTEDVKMCRAFARKTVDLSDESDWPNHHEWLLERLDALHAAFQTRVRNLQLEAR